MKSCGLKNLRRQTESIKGPRFSLFVFSPISSVSHQYVLILTAGTKKKESLRYLMMPLDHIDFHIIDI